MFDALAEAVDSLDVPLHQEALSAAFAIHARFTARLSAAVGAYEAAGHHELDGAATMSHWLRHHAGLDPSTAARTARRGRKLHSLPVLRQAFTDGRISQGKVDIILAHLKAKHVERFAHHEAELLPVLLPLTMEATARAMAEWRARVDALDDERPPGERDNELHLSATIDGRGELRGSFDADLHAVVEAALRVADSHDRQSSLSERRADALGQVCQHFLDHQRTRPAGRHRPHLNVAMTYQQFCATLGPATDTGGATYLDTGLPVSTAQLAVLRCDSALHRLLTGAGAAILDYRRATRTWPVDLYNAILNRDQGCRWPACTAPASWTDVHHVVPWEHGGSTSIDNGVMLCRRHHRRTHHPGWQVKLLPSGELEVTRPDGHTDTSPPRGPVVEPLWARTPGGG